MSFTDIQQKENSSADFLEKSQAPQEGEPSGGKFQINETMSRWRLVNQLVVSYKIFWFSPHNLGKLSQFDDRIFSDGLKPPTSEVELVVICVFFLKGHITIANPWNFKELGVSKILNQNRERFGGHPQVSISTT